MIEYDEDVALDALNERLEEDGMTLQDYIDLCREANKR